MTREEVSKINHIVESIITKKFGISLGTGWKRFEEEMHRRLDESTTKRNSLQI
jgi:hypothetical protein